MIRPSVTVTARDKKEALARGAGLLNVGHEGLNVLQVDEDSYRVSLKNCPGQVDIMISQDKMSAYIKAFLPPLGDGRPVTLEDVEKELAEKKVVFGIDREAIGRILSEFAKNGDLSDNVPIASGRRPEAGKDGRIEFKLGSGAVRDAPGIRDMVRPGQVMVIKVPATEGLPGKNILGEDVITRPGRKVELLPGENVKSIDNDTRLVSTIYGVAVTNHNRVQVRNPVRISEDRMSAEIPLFPILADNSRLSLEDVSISLKQAGVVHGIREDLIREVLEGGEPVDDLVVAKGTPARDGEDAGIEFKFLLNNESPLTLWDEIREGGLDKASIIKETVTGGDPLAVMHPLKRPVEGRTVTGEVLRGIQPRDMKLKAGNNVRILEDGVSYAVAEGVVGFADFQDDTLIVEDPVRVSDDRMSVYLTAHPPSVAGKMLTMDLARKLLSDRGVVHGIDWPAVEEALACASRKGAPVHDAPVARGDPPENGIDARIELKVTPDKIAGTIIDDTGRMDYRERGCIKNVKKGELLAVKVPFTKGTDGMDVFGNVIKATTGTDSVLVPSENVAISEDGLEYIAGIDGMVTLMDENNIGVSQLYQVPGDVDYSTGNLEMDGSLQITGWIRTGFDVRASCEIHVEGGIEGANVEAGGDILVKGGIIGSGEGRVAAGRDLTALFIENASVHANGNILVSDNVVRSRVTSNGNIYVTGGKGRIMGGEIEAFKGLEADEIGTAAGIRTRVSVGTDSTIRQQMDEATRRLEDFKRSKAKMDMVLARYAKRGKGDKLPRETARKLARVVKLRRDVVKAEGRLAKYREDLALKMAEADLGTAAIKVKKVVYSGTTIMVGGYAYEVRNDIPGQVKFILNINEKVVELLG